MPGTGRRLIAEAKERRIWRVLVAWPSLAFVLLQAVEFFINNYGLDGRWLTAGIIASITLFPAAVLWNWRHGEVGVQPFSRAEVGAYGLFLGLAAIAVYLYWNTTPSRAQRQAASETVRSVAVLPFDNPAGDAEVQYLCDGIAESLINWLASVPGVRVASKTASFRMRDESLDAAGLSRALGVDSLLRGRLERVGDQVVVSAALVDLRDDSQLWGERLAQPAADVLALERSIVNALTRGLRLSIAEDETRPPGGTDDPQAYQHYLRGHYLIQATDPDSVERGLDELRAAIRIDPGYARAWADIADALSQSVYYGLSDDPALVSEGRNAAYTAVALAPDLAESQTALAGVLVYFERDWKGADAAFEAAVALDSGSLVPYNRYSDYLAFTLRFDRGREIARRAIEIDPLDGSAMHAVGFVELFAGNFEAAAEALGEWNRFHPQSRWSWVKSGVALALSGRCDAAQEQLDVAREQAGERISTLMESWILWGRQACGAEKWRERAQARLDSELGHNPRSVDPGVAYLLALVNDGERLVELLDRIVESGNPVAFFTQVFLLEDMGWPVTATLVSDPAYRDLLARLDFPPSDRD